MVRVEEVAEPVGAAGPTDAFVRAVEVRNAVLEHELGSPEITDDPAELVPAWRDAHEPKRLFLAMDGERPIGCAVHETRHGEASDTAWIEAWVMPEARRRGVGTELWSALLRACADAGNRKALVYAMAGRRLSAIAPSAGGGAAPSSQGADAVVAGTGVGAIAPEEPGTAFLRARGARLEQVIRVSRFALPPEDGGARLASARASAEAAASGYHVETWAGPTSPDRLPGLAALHTRMSTDAPTAGLEEPEDVWTVERLLEREALDAESPATTLTAAIVHTATGSLVGFTQLAVPHREDRPVFQGDTLVLREHRGHRLGTLLKVANLQALAARRSAHPSVLTWNAEENRPMLDVNEATGFVPVGYEGAWRLDLPPAGSGTEGRV